jgi:L-rhamnose mutarotase
VRRFGQHAILKEDKIDEYVALHAAVWPEVLSVITDCHLHNYSIYISGNELFAYFEYNGNDYDEDMRRMDESDIMQSWWKHTKPCFLHHDTATYYLDWKEIFHLE